MGNIDLYFFHPIPEIGEIIHAFGGFDRILVIFGF